MLSVAGALGFSGCRPSGPDIPPGEGGPKTPWFEDGTAAAGLVFRHEVQTSGRYLFHESIGSGAAVLDFDNDGWLDVYLIHNAGGAASNRLFRQEAGGRFRDVSAGSGLDVAGFGNGVAVGDVTNDGLPEVLVTEYDRVRLFHNLGGGRFAEVTARAGLTNAHWSVPAAFFDYDRDGWLDLVIGNYLDFDPSQRCPDARGQPDFCGPHGFHPTQTRLFRNLGSGPGGPRFEDVTVRAGLARSPGKAMQIVCADFDGDQWPDVWVTDDGLPNRLFVNRRDGTFAEEAVARGLAYTGTGATAANMGIALGDVDGDGMFDVFVPHLAEEHHSLWRQGPRGWFQDETARAGLLGMAHGTGFGAVLADFDCDGAPDLAIANGLVRRQPNRLVPRRLVSGLPSFWAPYAETSQVFANHGTGRFREVSASNPAFCGDAFVGRGLVGADFDNDGGPDLLLVGIASPVRWCRNIALRGHWLGVRAIDPALGGRDAHGAEIVVRVGGRQRWGLVQPAHSYASSNDPRVHFGLGKATAVEGIEILWPDGTRESFPGGNVDRYLVLAKGKGRPSRP